MSEPVPAGSNFVREIVEADRAAGRVSTVVTRFPPEPNGYLHIGHAKAICVDFGIAQEFGGRCHLRMDDTNPLKEDGEFVTGIQRDIRWLGFDWGPHFYNASDYFGKLFEWAKVLIRNGKAYVDEQSEEQIRATRGTVESAGAPSPWRERPAAESLALFEKMNRGELPDGAMVLRAKIDMGHPNMKMRDPVMYRIRNVPHHHVGDAWRAYPMYDWAHGQSDAIEGVTHSLCSLEFDVNRELYDWYLDQLPATELASRPRQYEFARLVVTHTVTSKRLLKALVEEGHVSGWDDPRMPTLCGLRRRGVTPEAIRAFVERLGVSKAASFVGPEVLDHHVRHDLDARAPRALVVLDPLPLEVEGLASATIAAPRWPDGDRSDTRPVPISSRLLVERDDFSADPPPGWKRLAPGRSVRLRFGPVVTCTGHDVDADGRVIRVRAKVAGAKGAAIHWVDEAASVPVEVRLYETLFAVAEPGSERDFRLDLHPRSLTALTARAEPAVAATAPGTHLQFERLGFFFADPGAPGLVFHRTVALKDGWKGGKDAADEVAVAPAAPAAAHLAVVRHLAARGHALVARGLSEDEAEALQRDDVARAWFDAAVEGGAPPKAAASWVVTELPRVARDHGGHGNLRVTGAALGALAAMVDAGTITHAIGKLVLGILAAEGGDPARIVAERGLAPVADAGVLRAHVEAVVAANPAKVAEYRSGRTGLLGFFVGQVMARTQGRADAVAVKRLVGEALSG